MNETGQTADLSSRRRRLGASRETMAAGIGLHVDAVRTIEDGTASDEDRETYSAWLRRVEQWPAELRARQLLAAGKGRRFEPETE